VARSRRPLAGDVVGRVCCGTESYILYWSMHGDLPSAWPLPSSAVPEPPKLTWPRFKVGLVVVATFRPRVSFSGFIVEEAARRRTLTTTGTTV
jgi:hypothetical protein